MLASNSPFLGNGAFVLDLLSARPTSPCVFVLGTSPQSASFGSCTLYVAGALLPLATGTNAAGFASVKLALPLNPSLRGAAVWAQAAVADPLGAFAGLAFTAGLRLGLGD